MIINKYTLKKIQFLTISFVIILVSLNKNKSLDKWGLFLAFFASYLTMLKNMK